MNSKKLGLICIVIIAIAAIGSIFIVNQFSSKETQLQVLSSSTLYSSENFSVKLTDKDNNPIAGQSIDITFKEIDGEVNTVTLKTDENGIATSTVNGLNSGSFIVDISYGGDNSYKPSNLTTNIEVKTKVIETETSVSTSTSSSSNSDPYYDPNRDASHQSATEDNPVTVQQSDGVYTYYGPGHFDYYAGDNHMSGGYYKYKTENSY